MKIKTRFFAITLRARHLYVRLGSHACGLEARLSQLGSYCRWNWGCASWPLW